MKKPFVFNALVLTLTSQLMRIIGIFYIAFLSNKIGAEGIGLNQLIGSIYFLAATLASSGIGTAVSRLTAESIAKSGYRSISNVVRRSLLFSIFFGMLAGILLFLLSGFLGTSILGDSRSVMSLKVLSAELPFMAVTSCLRGYFYGVKKVMKPAVQMIFEQIVQLTVLFMILDFYVGKGLDYACFAIALSSVVSELMSCGLGIILYAFDSYRRKLAISHEKNINRQILEISVPIAGSSYLRSGLRTAENVLIPSGLRQYGSSEGTSLAQFGTIGMTMPVLLFPSSFLSAISTLLLPEISEANALVNINRIKNIFSRVFQLTAVFSVLFCGMFIVFANDLGTLIYRNQNICTLLMILAPLVPLIYIDFIVDSMLNALNRQVKTLKINLFDYSIRICLILILIPRFGFWAYIPIFYLSTILNAFLSVRCLLITINSKINFMNWLIKPLLSILLSGSLLILLSKIIHYSVLNWGVVIVKIIILTVLYFLILLTALGIKVSELFRLRQTISTPENKNT